MAAPRIANLVQKELPPELESLTHRVIGCAIEVHRELGPGLLEKIYEDALVYELLQAGLEPRRQVAIDIRYKTTILRGQRLDLIVNDLLVVEIKSIAEVLDVHRAQTLSYLRAAGLPLALLLNFNTTLLKAGLDRIFNERALANSFPPLSSSSSRPSR